MDWATAFNYCRSANYNGTGWRLPTQRELQLMRIFRPALEDLIVNNLGGVAFAVENYWTATEVNTTTAWAVHLDTSLTNSAPKTSGYHARCVRDM